MFKKPTGNVKQSIQETQSTSYIRQLKESESGMPKPAFFQRKYWKVLFEIPFTQKHTRTSYLKIVFKYEKSLLTLLYLMAKPDDIALFALCHNTKDDERSSGLWEADFKQTCMCRSMAFLKPDTWVYNPSSLNCAANDKELLNFLICKYPFEVISKS